MARAAGKTPAKRRIEPYAQGDLDGMCAIYTIINAVRALCPEMTIGASTALFRRLIRSLDTHTNDARTGRFYTMSSRKRCCFSIPTASVT